MQYVDLQGSKSGPLTHLSRPNQESGLLGVRPNPHNHPQIDSLSQIASNPHVIIEQDTIVRSLSNSQRAFRRGEIRTSATSPKTMPSPPLRKCSLSADLVEGEREGGELIPEEGKAEGLQGGTTLKVFVRKKKVAAKRELLGEKERQPDLDDRSEFSADSTSEVEEMHNCGSIRATPPLSPRQEAIEEDELRMLFDSTPKEQVGNKKIYTQRDSDYVPNPIAGPQNSHLTHSNPNPDLILNLNPTSHEQQEGPILATEDPQIQMERTKRDTQGDGDLDDPVGGLGEGLTGTDKAQS